METKLILINPNIDEGVYVCNTCAHDSLYEGLITAVAHDDTNPMCIDCHDLLWPDMPN